MAEIIQYSRRNFSVLSKSLTESQPIGMILSNGPGVMFLTLGIILVLHYSSAEDSFVFPYGREAELFDYLTNSSRYDSRTRPLNYDVLEVKNSVFVYFLGNIRAQQLEFEAHLLIRQKWQDKKLSFANVSTNIEYMEGETWFADHIWTPNIFIENEVNSDLMTMTRDSVYIRIQSNGIVNYHYRIRTVVLCDIIIIIIIK
ncbi:glutamate-gated chloride channel [Eurytemora carolleeae]|uniref:glutamate-gated chloride channel n=1 Tax=Eurytemora carolleeae TaxID=1294199 RepID=UPI000C770188|nr:glutamate-gated chloride channel [Eurytemora carolleeae]|eukprot:XP_023347443.1 glutamate-gated chloride channel-like [Eurytemora affinis]